MNGEEEFQQDFFEETELTKYNPEDEFSGYEFDILKIDGFIEIPNKKFEYNTIYDPEILDEIMKDYNNGLYTIKITKIDYFEGQYDEYGRCEISEYISIEDCEVKRKLHIEGYPDYMTLAEKNQDELDQIQFCVDKLKEENTEHFIVKSEWVGTIYTGIKYQISLWNEIGSSSTRIYYNNNITKDNVFEVCKKIKELKLNK